MSERLSQELAIVGQIDPTASTGTFTTDVIDMSKFDHVIFITQVGEWTTGTTGSVQLTVNEGETTGAVSTSIGTNSALASTGDNDKQQIFEVDAEDLTGPTYRYIQGSLAVEANGPAAVSCVALGGKARFHPASDDDISSVDEITVST